MHTSENGSGVPNCRVSKLPWNWSLSFERLPLSLVLATRSKESWLGRMCALFEWAKFCDILELIRILLSSLFSRCRVLCVKYTVYYTCLLILTCIFHNVFFLVIAGCPATTVQCGICEVILSPSWRKCIIIMLMCFITMCYVYHYSDKCTYIALWRLHIFVILIHMQ